MRINGRNTSEGRCSPIDSVQAVFVAVAAMLVLVVGCTHDQVPVVEYAGWSPTYHAWMTHSDHPAVAERAADALSWRSGMKDYWVLVSLLLREAPTADYLAIIERLPEGSEHDYAFAILIQRGREGRAYASSSSLLPMDNMREVSSWDRWPARGKVNVGAVSRELFDWLDDLGVWHTWEGILEMVGDEPTLDQGAVAIYAWRRRDGRFVTGVIEPMMLTAETIRGQEKLSDLPQWRVVPLPGETVTLENWQTLPYALKETWRSKYKVTYYSRLIANGVLKAVYAEGMAAPDSGLRQRKPAGAAGEVVQTTTSQPTGLSGQ